MRLILILLIVGLIGCEEEETQIFGCMDSQAENYNSLATDDDGSCTYPPPPDPIDTVYKFVMVEYTTADNYDALTDLKISFNNASYSSAVVPIVAEMPVIDGGGDLTSDVENHLIYYTNQDYVKIFYQQTMLSVPLSIYIFRISDHALIFSCTFSSDGSVSTSYNLGSDFYRATRSTGGDPFVMWYIKI